MGVIGQMYRVYFLWDEIEKARFETFQSMFIFVDFVFCLEKKKIDTGLSNVEKVVYVW